MDGKSRKNAYWMRELSLLMRNVLIWESTYGKALYNYSRLSTK
jgi:hypothetical protein